LLVLPLDPDEPPSEPLLEHAIAALVTTAKPNTLIQATRICPPVLLERNPCAVEPDLKTHGVLR